MKTYIDYIFSKILRVKPISVEVFPEVINVSLPEGMGEIVSTLNLTNLMVSYSLPVTETMFSGDTIHFALSPIKNLEEMKVSVLRGIVSRWPGIIHSCLEKESDLPVIFRDYCKQSILVSWICSGDIVDVGVSSNQPPSLQKLNAFSINLSRDIEAYEPLPESQVSFLRQVWNIVYSLVSARIHRGILGGNIELQINTPDPGAFSVHDIAGWNTIVNSFDGNEYDSSTPSGMRAIKSLVESWKKDL